MYCDGAHWLLHTVSCLYVRIFSFFCQIMCWCGFPSHMHARVSRNADNLVSLPLGKPTMPVCNLANHFAWLAEEEVSVLGMRKGRVPAVNTFGPRTACECAMAGFRDTPPSRNFRAPLEIGRKGKGELYQRKPAFIALFLPCTTCKNARRKLGITHQSRRNLQDSGMPQW